MNRRRRLLAGETDGDIPTPASARRPREENLRGHIPASANAHFEVPSLEWTIKDFWQTILTNHENWKPFIEVSSIISWAKGISDAQCQQLLDELVAKAMLSPGDFPGEYKIIEQNRLPIHAAATGLKGQINK